MTWFPNPHVLEVVKRQIFLVALASRLSQINGKSPEQNLEDAQYKALISSKSVEEILDAEIDLEIFFQTLDT